MTEERTPASELVLYQTEDGRTRIQCHFEGETLWLTQAQMAELFQIGVGTVNHHLKAVYAEGELPSEATIRRRRIVRTEGNRSVSREIEHYNLEAILAVGFRVRSPRGTQFRRWAIERLDEYLVKGFAMDDERLKRPLRPVDYFDELLERIREIRASEQRVYQRIRDIFALASDYDPSRGEARRFFAVMQNKMHYAATGLTAAEIVRRRALASEPNMGLTAWSGDRVRKHDASVAKNYLSADEIDTLNRIVVMFLDRAEFRAKRRRDIRMTDWERDLDRFLADAELPVLGSAGSVSQEEAAEWASEQYAAFSERRRLEDESRGEAEYFEELTETAKLLESEAATHTEPPARKGRGKRR